MYQTITLQTHSSLLGTSPFFFFHFFYFQFHLLWCFVAFASQIHNNNILQLIVTTATAKKATLYIVCDTIELTTFNTPTHNTKTQTRGTVPASKGETKLSSFLPFLHLKKISNANKKWKVGKK